jgi:hypothetical protein
MSVISLYRNEIRLGNNKKYCLNINTYVEAISLFYIVRLLMSMLIHEIPSFVKSIFKVLKRSRTLEDYRKDIRSAWQDEDSKAQ